MITQNILNLIQSMALHLLIIF